MERTKKILIGLGLAFALLLTVSGSYVVAYWNKILPGVRMAGVAVGNRTGEEAAGLVKLRLSETGLVDIRVVSGEHEWVLKAEEVEVEVDLPSSINNAWLIGRSGGLLERLGQAQRAYFEGINLSLEIKIDEAKLNEWVEGVSLSIDEPAIDPELSVVGEGEDKKIEVNLGKDGLKIDRDDLRNKLIASWQNLSTDSVELPIMVMRASLDDERAEVKRKEAEVLLNKKIEISFEDELWVLEDRELIRLIALKNGVGFDEEKVEKILKEYVEGVERDPQNAAFKFEKGRVLEFRAGKDGVEVKHEKLTEEIVGAFEKLKKSELVTISTPVRYLPPEITTAEVNDLGIRELLGVGKSTYFHSIPNRVHNVSLASLRIDGALIKPGEVFSFNRTLGDVSQSTGFRTAYIISGGRTVLGDGGGVCQVSTTLFRAILDAGLPITERKAHSYRVTYYEQNSLPGIDATVYSPTVDLKFRNDTPGHLLIQVIIDEANRALTFEIYGTNDGRISEVTTPKVWGQTPAPPPLYQDDPTLAVGVVKQIDWAAAGAKTSFDYTVTREGEVLSERTFYSNFRPWQAVYLRGTKVN